MDRSRLGKACSPACVLSAIALLSVVATFAVGFGSRVAQTTVRRENAAARPQSDSGSSNVRVAYGNLPLIFEQNQGQTDSQVKFLARGSGYGLFLTGDGPVLTLRDNSTTKRAADFSVLRMKLAGANAHAAIQGDDQLPGRSNYFIGNDPAKWHTDVPQFSSVRYNKIYPGIDLVFHGNQGRLEYDFEVAPGGEPSQVALKFDGAHRASINSAGDLVLSLPSGDVAMHAPRAYQKNESSEQPVASRFALRADGDVGFELGSYDRSRTLIIDPILSYSTYLGGSGNEACSIILGHPSTPVAGCPAVAVDPTSNAYIAGSTTSVDFPIPIGGAPFQSTLKGTANIFVAKFNPTGSTELFATYIGGNGVDTTAGVAVDTAFNVVVTGNTTSSNFPVENAFQSAPLNSNNHAFVSKLNPAGQALLYSSYLSGNGIDTATGVALDPGGNAYVTGTTTSTEGPTAGFPSTVGAFQTAPATGSTIQFFLTKINPTLSGTSSVPYSTYFGGGNSIRPASDGPPAVGGGVAVDVNSNIYITGGTSYLHVGAPNDFPILNAFQGCLDSPDVTTCPTNVSAYDVFVAKLNPTAVTGTQLIYSTYIGGTGDDIGNGIAVDSAFDAYVTGSTDSSDFPAGGAGVFQTTYGGDGDAFLVKFGPPTNTGTQQGTVPLDYFTYLGGTGEDVGLAVAVDTIQNAWVTGWTNSSSSAPGTFPNVNNTVQGTYGGGTSDAFVARVGTSLNVGTGTGNFATYLGGGGVDYGTGIAVDPQGASYVSGETTSTNFPTVNAFQPGLGGGAGSDAFLSKLAPITSLGLQVTASPSPVGVGNQVTYQYTLTNNGDATNNITFTDFLPATGTANFVSATTAPGTCGAATGGTVLCNVGTLNTGATATITVILIPSAPTTPNTSPVSLTNSAAAGISGSSLATANSTVTVNDFTLTVAPNTATVQAGVPANFTATLTPTGSIPDSVSLSCAGLPTGSTCVETTNPIPNLATGPASTTVVINTTMRVTTVTQLLRKGAFYASLLPLTGLVFVTLNLGGAPRRRRKALGLMLGCLFGLSLFLLGCGSKSTTNTTGTPAGTYIVTISAASNQATRTAIVTLIVQ